MFTALRRIIKSGFLSFVRNGWLSTATILVMSLVLFVLGNLVFLGAFTNTAIDSFESKIDITVYFTPEAEENAILAVKREVQAIPAVVDTSYVSKEEAYTDFREKHKDNAFIGSALDEIGQNPLVASLNVKARSPQDYAAISDFLVKKNYPVVDKVNYYENQEVINRLGSLASTIRGAGAFAALILAFIAVLVAFNTIRLAIYTVREEIGIMRLVGASTWFIRGPFLTAGVMYGAIAATGITLAFFPLTWVAAPKMAMLLPNFDVYKYFIANFAEFYAIMLSAGIILGVLSSAIAIRKYLKV